MINDKKPKKRRFTQNKKKGLNFINLASYTSPEIIEVQNKEWVEYGADNNYFQYLIDLFHGSPTNSAAINGISQFISGRGLDALDSSEKPNDYATMKGLFTDDCLKKLAIDLKLFGQCSVQVIYNAEHTQIVQVEHYPVETLRAEKANEEGEVEAYYYASDWTEVRSSADTKRISAFGCSNDGVEILYIKPYKSGFFYYSPVDYQGATTYAEMEGEIGNFHLSSILNGMSPGLLLNFNSGIPDEDTQSEIERKIIQKYTGSSNSGKFILAFNNNSEEQATVETIQLSDAHQQYQFLSEESAQKIIIGHRITSPMLLGIKNNTGLGSNKDELITASILFENTVVKPFQDLLLSAFDEILAYNDINLKLYIKTLQPLEFFELDNTMTGEEREEQTGQKLSLKVIDGEEVYKTKEEAEKVAIEKGCEGSHEHKDEEGNTWYMPCKDHDSATNLKDKDDPCTAGYEQYGMKIKDGREVPNCIPIEAAEDIRRRLYSELSEKGEDEDLENWELIDARPTNEYDNIVRQSISLASVISSTPNQTSDQDTSILKVRYAYMGSNNPQREFCQLMWSANKVYRREDLDSDDPNYNGNANNVNEGFGLEGADNYNIFLYKGGVNCKHYWERRTYLRKNNKRISVTEAIRKINELDPSLRDEARFETNPPEVAQTAKASNNYWRA